MVWIAISSKDSHDYSLPTNNNIQELFIWCGRCTFHEDHELLTSTISWHAPGIMEATLPSYINEAQRENVSPTCRTNDTSPHQPPRLNNPDHFRLREEGDTCIKIIKDTHDTHHCPQNGKSKEAYLDHIYIYIRTWALQPSEIITFSGGSVPPTLIKRLVFSPHQKSAFKFFCMDFCCIQVSPYTCWDMISQIRLK